MAVVLPKPAGARTSTSLTVAAAISSRIAVRGTCVAVKAGGLSLVSRMRGVEGDIGERGEAAWPGPNGPDFRRFRRCRR